MPYKNTNKNLRNSQLLSLLCIMIFFALVMISLHLDMCLNARFSPIYRYMEIHFNGESGRSPETDSQTQR